MTRTHDDNVRDDIRNLIHPYTPLGLCLAPMPQRRRTGALLLPCATPQIAAQLPLTLHSGGVRAMFCGVLCDVAECLVGLDDYECDVRCR